jgi:rRNA maturation protein Nop10
MECRKEVIVDGVRVYEDKMKRYTLEEAITACGF